MTENSPSSALEVPGEPGVYWCARHRKIKTRLRCGRCETPICTKCTKIGPIGARCPDCFANKSAHIYQVSPLHHLLTFLIAGAISFIGATVVSWIGFLLLFAPVIGTFMGRAIIWATRGKRGTALTITAVVATVLAALVPLAVRAIAAMAIVSSGAAGGGQDAAAMAAEAFLLPLALVLIYLVLVIPTLWYWLK